MRRAFGSVLLLLLAACSRQKGMAPPAAPAANPPEAAEPPPLPYELRLGRATFVHYCQTCHGETGEGDGFNAFNLDPKPRDLSSPDFQKTKTDADLADAIRRGGAGVGLSPLMPPWGRTLTPVQVDQVVRYLRILKKKDA